MRFMGRGRTLGQFPIPPSMPIPLGTILEPLRERVRTLLVQLPPDLQAPESPYYIRLVNCNATLARGDFENGYNCLERLGIELAEEVERYQRIPLAVEREGFPTTSALYAVGGLAALGVLLTVLR